MRPGPLVLLLALALLPGARGSTNGASGQEFGASLAANVLVVMNEYTAIGPAGAQVARDHDPNGHRTADGTRTLVWDAFNRLVGVARKSDGAPIAAYSYLPDGRRSRKVVYSQSAPGVVAREVRFVWDGAQEVEEQSAAGTTLASFVWSPVYVDELVEYRREAAHPLGAGSFFAHQDARCDVVAVTNASGQVVEKRRVDDFGREEIRDAGGAVVAASPSGLEWGFQGRRRDAETGWLYFRARYYSAQEGRFLSRDPVWDAGNVGGWYTFVGNTPTSRRDPLGTSGGAEVGGGLAAAAEWLFGAAAGTAAAGAAVVVGVAVDAYLLYKVSEAAEELSKAWKAQAAAEAVEKATEAALRKKLAEEAAKRPPRVGERPRQPRRKCPDAIVVAIDPFEPHAQVMTIVDGDRLATQQVIDMPEKRQRTREQNEAVRRKKISGDPRDLRDVGFPAVVETVPAAEFAKGKNFRTFTIPLTPEQASRARRFQKSQAGKQREYTGEWTCATHVAEVVSEALGEKLDLPEGTAAELLKLVEKLASR